MTSTIPEEPHHMRRPLPMSCGVELELIIGTDYLNQEFWNTMDENFALLRQTERERDQIKAYLFDPGQNPRPLFLTDWERRRQQAQQQSATAGPSTPYPNHPPLPDTNAPWLAPSGPSEQAADDDDDGPVSALYSRLATVREEINSLRHTLEMPLPDSAKYGVRHRMVADAVSTLRAAGVPVADEEVYGKASDYTRWFVTEDTSIDLGAAEGLEIRAQAVEVVSRKLTVGVEGVEFGDGAEIRKVLDTLTSTFAVNVNETTGLHVHVGRQDRRIPFFTARRVAAFVLAFEHVLNQVHPYKRISNIFTDVPSKANRSHSSFTIDYRLAMLWRTYSPIAVALIMNQGNRYGAYNFDAMHRIGTIEFRQHEGTVDVDAVMNWVKFCTQLVWFAHEADDIMIRNLIAQKMKDPAFSFCDLLKEVGFKSAELESLQSFYRPRCRTHNIKGYLPPWDPNANRNKMIQAVGSTRYDEIVNAEKRNQVQKVRAQHQDLFKANELKEHAEAMGAAGTQQQAPALVSEVSFLNQGIDERINIRLETTYDASIEVEMGKLEEGYREKQDMVLQRRETRRQQAPERQQLRRSVKEGTITADEFMERTAQLDSELPFAPTNVQGWSKSSRFSRSTGTLSSVRDRRSQRVQEERDAMNRGNNSGTLSW